MAFVEGGHLAGNIAAGRRGNSRRSCHPGGFQTGPINPLGKTPAVWRKSRFGARPPGARLSLLRSRGCPSAVMRHLRENRIQIERGRLLPRREFREVRHRPRDHGLHLVKLGNVVDHPVQVGVRVVFRSLERSRRRLTMYGIRSFTKGSAHCRIVSARCTARWNFQSPTRTAMTSPSSLK